MDSPTSQSSAAGNYVVVARRYRPKNFQELVGQSQVAVALSNAIETDRVGHAYLFTGARGVGKTSTARIFAKCLNCMKGPTTTPCGECDVCQGVNEGEDIDVVEIDGASNRNIDDIRQLRANIHVRPSRTRYKVYIIDEVHMLTTQAFNALLKTLEEPPEHVKFIFCTTEADKVPITVLSRCQRFDFSPMEMDDLVGRLAHVCEKEGIATEPEALRLLARRANGSMRDSQSLLEQLLSFCGTKLTAEAVHRLLGTADTAHLKALFEAIVARQPAVAWQTVDEAVRRGVDVGALAEQLLGYLRDAVALMVGCSRELLSHVGPSEADELLERANRFGLETTLAAMQILDQTLVRMRQSVHGRTLLELALVRMGNLRDVEALSHLLSMARSGAAPGLSLPADRSGRSAMAVASAPPSTAAAVRPSVAEKATEQVAIRENLGVAPEVASVEKTAPSASGPSAPAADLPPMTREEGEAAWRQGIAELEVSNEVMTADLARVGRFTAISAPDRLVVSFTTAYNLKMVDRPDRREKITAAVSLVAGRPVTLEFRVETPADKPPEPKVSASQAAQQKFKRKQNAQRHPLVAKAMDLFEAEVADVFEQAPKKTDGEGEAE